MSFRKSSSQSGTSSTKKYAVVNATVHKPPAATQSNQQGKLLVLHRPAPKTTAPAPINTASLRRENNGKDTTVALVPVGQTTVWGGGNKPSETETQPETEQQASQNSNKPAPWAKSNEPPPVETPPVQQNSSGTSGAKMQSWASTDSDDSDDDLPPPAPLPGYQPSSIPPTTSVSAPVPPSSASSTVSTASALPSSTPTVTNPVIRRNLAEMTNSYSGRSGGFTGRDSDRGGDYRDRNPGAFRGDDRGDSFRQQPAYQQPQQTRGWRNPDPERDRFQPSGGNQGGFSRSDARAGFGGRIVTTPGVVRGQNDRPSTTTVENHGAASGPKFESGMTEEQMALERARYEREQLEIQKRNQQFEAEEARRRQIEEEERERMRQKERELELEREKIRERERNLMLERERERDREFAERERERERQREIEREEAARNEGRWERASMYSGNSRDVRRGNREMPYGDYRPRLYSGDGDRDRDRDRAYSFDSTGSRGSRNGDRDRYPSNVSNANAYPHRLQQNHPDSSHPPTRILQHDPAQPQQKKLFDSKSGNFIIQKEKETPPPSANTSAAPSSIWGAKAVQNSNPKPQKDSAQAARDKKREARVQEMNAIAMQEQQKREQKVIALKEARAKERADREPRTQGALFRFVTEEDAVELQKQEQDRPKNSCYGSATAVRLIEGKYLSRVLSSWEKKKLLEKDERDKERKSHHEKSDASDDNRKTKKENKKANAKKPKGQGQEKSEGDKDVELDLAALTLDDDVDALGDILQESVEFQEVKSKRTVAQEKKLSDHSDTPSTNSARPRPDKRDVKGAGNTSSQPSTVSNTVSVPSPTPNMQSTPAQPAWIDTGNTFKVIGVPVPEQSPEKEQKPEGSGKKSKISKEKGKEKEHNDKIKNDRTKKDQSAASKKTSKSERDNRKSKTKNLSSHSASDSPTNNSDAENGGKNGHSNSSPAFDFLNPTQHQNPTPLATTDILDMSVEIDQQDLNQNMRGASYSRFVPGIGLTGSDEVDSSVPSNSTRNSAGEIQDRANATAGGLEALMGLGATVSMASFDSSSTWQFHTNSDEAPSFRPHANSNVSDDENAYTHHTAALTQLTEGDDDHIPYAHSTALNTANHDGEPEKSAGSDSANVEGKSKFKSKTGKPKSGRGGKGGSEGRGRGRESFSRGGKGGRGRGGRSGPPAVPQSVPANVHISNDSQNTDGTSSPSTKKQSKDKDHSNDDKKIHDVVSVKNEDSNDQGAPPSGDISPDATPASITAGGRGRGRGSGRGGKGNSYGGRGGRGRGGKRGSTGDRSERPSRGPPAVSS